MSLFSAEGVLVSTINQADGWLFGIDETRASMSFVDGAWCTSTTMQTGFIGSPKQADSCTPSETPADPQPTMMDADCNGTWNLVDIVVIKQYDTFITQGADDCATVQSNENIRLYTMGCDVNGDGACTLVNAVVIQQCNAFIPNPHCSKMQP